MMRFIISCLVLFISGCAMSPSEVAQYQKQHDFENHKVQTNGGYFLSVNDLRDRYKKETGMDLPTQDTSSCSDDKSCYYSKYASAYGVLSAEYQGKQEAKRYVEETARCDADEECSKNKKITNLKDHLRNSYYSVMSANPYLRSDYDMAFRNLCENASNSASSGENRTVMLNRIQDKPGIDPYTRQLVLDAAATCWDITSLGGNWKEALR